MDPLPETVNYPARTPLPKFQIFILNLIQFAEPVTATVIYPFVNRFVRETGITLGDEKKTGYFAGIIESVFFFAEALTVLYWGKLSDRVGRRPVLLLGPLGLSLAMFGFGVSQKFWQLVVYRSLQGVFNGNIGVSKSVTAEITDATNIADAFALLPLMWSVGVTVGPILGGVLSNPADRWPAIFGNSTFFRQHPYSLPCTAAAAIAFVSFSLSFLGLKETLPAIVSARETKDMKPHTTSEAFDAPCSTTTLLGSDDFNDYGSSNQPADALISTRESPNKTRQPPPLSALLIPQVLIPLLNYMFFTFTDMSIQALQPLMFSTSIELGGLGLDPYKIGMIMGIWGFINAVIQLNFLNALIRKFGPRATYIAAYSGFLIAIGAYPILGYLARRAGRMDTMVWIFLIIQLTSQMSMYIGFTAIQIIIIQSVPSRGSMGAINGLAQTLACSMRTLAPSIASSLFSISLERNLAGGNLVYIILLGINLIGIRTSFMLLRA
ncbi:major facilitator superfamily multidrug-resistance, DHA1 sub-family [Infundibulicybe gibba]|nr:major facilitator superfamily multidrug-resistance, DHA1 sub-family [Infundibulicybe gibba]